MSWLYLFASLLLGCIAGHGQSLVVSKDPSKLGLKYTKTEGLRPLPSDKLPVLPLIEYPDFKQDPKGDDLNLDYLQTLLGKKYDPVFMSVVRPIESILRPNGTLVYKFKKGRPNGELPPEIRQFMTATLPNGVRLKDKLSRKSRRRFQKYLWAYTYCPVEYKWLDLGLRFWPRWIREGKCYNGRSCSIPSGMSCKVSRSTTMTLLRWHCRRWNGTRMCKWIPIHYPIITQCSCRC